MRNAGKRRSRPAETTDSFVQPIINVWLAFVKVTVSRCKLLLCSKTFRRRRLLPRQNFPASRKLSRSGTCPGTINLMPHILVRISYVIRPSGFGANSSCDLDTQPQRTLERTRRSPLAHCRKQSTMSGYHHCRHCHHRHRQRAHLMWNYENRDDA